MPRPIDPTKPEFYVYRILADGVPFYVGVGRSARASDRVRYVGYLMRREAEGKPVQWSLHTRVPASLIRAGCTLEVEYRRTGVVRDDALAQEDKEILELVSAGRILDMGLPEGQPAFLRGFERRGSPRICGRDSRGASH